ncbi:uncharacterized protein TNCV_255261 [Trichonephila clavipes]|nr:uncharacterized protein TNCV_255261 [Trichonephila clavipes]
MTTTGKRIPSFAQSIPGYQGCDENVETSGWHEMQKTGFQMLNDHEIVTSVQEESDPVDDETDKVEYNHSNESSKSNADAFSVLETAMKWYEQQ